MSYTLFYSPDSAAIIVRMVMEEMQLDYVAEEVPRYREDRSETFMALNPRGLLPALMDHETGGGLFETGAVLLYLADKHKALIPGEGAAKDRGDCLKWLFMISNTLHADLAITFYSDRYADTKENAAQIAAVSAESIRGHFETLNTVVAASASGWLLSTGLSICDFYLGCCLRWAQLYPSGQPTLTAETLKRFPALLSLMKRLEARPSVIAAAGKEGIEGSIFFDPKSPLRGRFPAGNGGESDSS